MGPEITPCLSLIRRGTEKKRQEYCVGCTGHYTESGLHNTSGDRCRRVNAAGCRIEPPVYDALFLNYVLKAGYCSMEILFNIPSNMHSFALNYLCMHVQAKKKFLFQGPPTIQLPGKMQLSWRKASQENILVSRDRVGGSNKLDND
ncbi:hypothetical protein CDAR_204901 [Caerostris darwini]|uniref:LAGLIDADG homing endonuclease n=1 Tax=Caerostris darwini TaxID=1538125 RepID=A0AAV4PFA3_9ARAC|nr:hypothetical protein CDAR_204901 [Caerostris darwini]